MIGASGRQVPPGLTIGIRGIKKPLKHACATSGAKKTFYLAKIKILYCKIIADLNTFSVANKRTTNMITNKISTK